VALGLHELAIKCCLYGFWGGSSGNWLKEKCLMLGINCFGPVNSGANRKCYTLITNQKHSDLNNTELLEPGPSISPEEFDLFMEDFGKKEELSDFICMSGSWPDGAPDNAYYDLVNMAHEKGKKVIIDASGRQLQNALHVKPFGVHTNREEAKLICPEDSWERALEYLSGCTELAALTLGKEGLYLNY
jgi:tagatose 6-phosphate kinase